MGKRMGPCGVYPETERGGSSVVLLGVEDTEDGGRRLLPLGGNRVEVAEGARPPMKEKEEELAAEVDGFLLGGMKGRVQGRGGTKVQTDGGRGWGRLFPLSVCVYCTVGCGTILVIHSHCQFHHV